MAHVDQLVNYFNSAWTHGELIGAEVETFFITEGGTAISVKQSQAMLRRLVSRGWSVAMHKGSLITEVCCEGNRVQYELGYPNLELSVCPRECADIIDCTRGLLEGLYEAGASCGALPLFTPVYAIEGDFLAIPDERDAAWLSLDGRAALSPLARISAVQFTVNVHAEEAIHKVNNLNARRDLFLKEYPQDVIWRQYIAESSAGYREDRYGGPAQFESSYEYCMRLSEHSVVSEQRLVPFKEADLGSNEQISLFLRSIWWYFRLRRYGHNLCIEGRPFPRRDDECLEGQLNQMLEAMK